MTNANTPKRWRPHPLVYFYCSVAIALLGGACSWGFTLLIARCCQPEATVEATIAGAGIFILVLYLSLRRCSTPALPALRGLLVITSYMTVGIGSFSLLLVIPAVIFAIVAVIAIALLSLFRNDAASAQKQFQNLMEFYRKHRMYQ